MPVDNFKLFIQSINQSIN